MKKILLVLLSIAIILTLFGCDSKKRETIHSSLSINTPTNTPISTPTATPEAKQTSTNKTSVSSSSEKRSSSSFTNKYGTSTTICAHIGCNNYIASSGDTNCCIIHSRKCAECGKYIDEDAIYCMDCIEKAAKEVTTYSSSTKKCDKSGCSNNATKSLKVTQPSGESETFSLCSSHYSELKSFFNSKKGWKAE